MKKNLFIAALLCSISFAGKAATNEIKTAAVEKSAVTTAEVSKPTHVRLRLEELTFNCAAGGWSVQCYGSTLQEALTVYRWYAAHTSC